MRPLKNLLKACLWKGFELGQRAGFDILPRHFYSEIPNLRELRADSSWRRPYTMKGVTGAAVESQLDMLRGCLTPALVEHLRGVDVHGAACKANGEPGYGRAEADFLFAYIATQRPSEILQVGCGVSTAVCIAAAAHAGYQPQITCVEPYPTIYLRHLADNGTIRLISRRAQDLPLTDIETLGPEALLFVDSTHTLGPAGEVSRIILEWLPRLKKGARVHFHDILFPYDYDRHVLSGALFFQHESVLLHAFLAHNSRFCLQVSLSCLHYLAGEKLRALLPHYEPALQTDGLAVGPGDFPSATFLAVVA